MITYQTRRTSYSWHYGTRGKLFYFRGTTIYNNREIL